MGKVLDGLVYEDIQRLFNQCIIDDLVAVCELFIDQAKNWDTELSPGPLMDVFEQHAYTLGSEAVGACPFEPIEDYLRGRVGYKIPPLPDISDTPMPDPNTFCCLYGDDPAALTQKAAMVAFLVAEMFKVKAYKPEAAVMYFPLGDTEELMLNTMHHLVTTNGLEIDNFPIQMIRTDDISILELTNYIRFTRRVAPVKLVVIDNFEKISFTDHELARHRGAMEIELRLREIAKMTETHVLVTKRETLMTLHVPLADLRELAKLYPKMKSVPWRTPGGTRALRRRLKAVTLAAGDGVLLFESGALRKSIPASGDLDSITVDARVLEQHTRTHSAERLELVATKAELVIKGGSFRTAIPALE